MPLAPETKRVCSSLNANPNRWFTPEVLPYGGGSDVRRPSSLFRRPRFWLGGGGGGGSRHAALVAPISPVDLVLRREAPLPEPGGSFEPLAAASPGVAPS